MYSFYVSKSNQIFKHTWYDFIHSFYINVTISLDLSLNYTCHNSIGNILVIYNDINTLLVSTLIFRYQDNS